MNWQVLKPFLPLSLAILCAVAGARRAAASPNESIPPSKQYVSVNGAVYKPGRVPLPPRLMLDELLFGFAGGLLPDAEPSRIKLRRTDGTILILDVTLERVPESPLRMSLRDGDDIVVSTRPNTIVVLGNVQRTSQLTLLPGQRVRDVLAQPDLLRPTKSVGWITE